MQRSTMVLQQYLSHFSSGSNPGEAFLKPPAVACAPPAEPPKASTIPPAAAGALRPLRSELGLLFAAPAEAEEVEEIEVAHAGLAQGALRPPKQAANFRNLGVGVGLLHRVGRGLVDGARALRVGGLLRQAEVALLTPGGSPAVLHDPVAVLTVGVVAVDVAHRQYAVVEILAAALVVDHAGGVELEGGGGADGHGNGLVGHGLLQRVAIVDGDVFVGVDGHRGAVVLPTPLARQVPRPVPVVRFRVDAPVFNDVLKGEVHEATAAAHVLGGVARDQLLFGQADQLAGLDRVDALDRPSGGEGPAGAAHGLVLHGSDCPTLAPVHGGGDVGDCGVAEAGGLGASTHLTAHLCVETQPGGGKLLKREIRELVDRHFEGGKGIGVVGLDSGSVRLENPQALCLLIGIVDVVLVVAGEPQVECLYGGSLFEK